MALQIFEQYDPEILSSNLLIKNIPEFLNEKKKNAKIEYYNFSNIEWMEHILKDFTLRSANHEAYKKFFSISGKKSIYDLLFEKKELENTIPGLSFKKTTLAIKNSEYRNSLNALADALTIGLGSYTLINNDEFIPLIIASGSVALTKTIYNSGKKFFLKNRLNSIEKKLEQYKVFKENVLNSEIKYFNVEAAKNQVELFEKVQLNKQELPTNALNKRLMGIYKNYIIENSMNKLNSLNILVSNRW